MAETSDPVTPEPEPESPAADVKIELHKLLDLAVKYPDIGPPLAELAFKIGQREFGERVVRMGLEAGTKGVEYYFVASGSARREGRHGDALAITLDAVRAFAASPDAPGSDDGARLLHLVRQGFSTLLFDLEDVRAEPGFVKALAEVLPPLEPRLGADPFFHVMMAQLRWFDDAEASEREWDRAAELGEPEHTWNARGTWYKEAARDVDRAERAYRQGLEQAPQSALLRHNLAQLLVGKAGGGDVGVDLARRLLREADDHLRTALREDSPKGLRRHIHGTRDRLNELRASLPGRGRGGGGGGGGGEDRPPAPAEPDSPPPEVGAVVTGRVVSLTAYGAFVNVGGGHVGLLHKNDLAHEQVHDPARLLKVGDDVEVKVMEVGRREGGGRLRIGLSRKALLPAPANAPAARPERPRPERNERGDGRPDRGERAEARPERRDDRRPRRDERPIRNDKFLEDGKVSLGQMILAKLKEQGK